jgi:hypothetical protein
MIYIQPSNQVFQAAELFTFLSQPSDLVFQAVELFNILSSHLI